jgi:chemotaxis protein CheD
MTAQRNGDIFLQAGDFYFGAGSRRLRTVLGTCVAIAMWHPVKRVGGLCHFLLPARCRAAGAGGAAAGFYADEVMQLFADAVASWKTRSMEYVVKVSGGGNMFPNQQPLLPCRGTVCTALSRTVCPNVGCRNISAAHRLLAAHGYTISSEHVGGLGSRHVLFNLGTGDVLVRRGAAMTPLAGVGT